MLRRFSSPGKDGRTFALCVGVLASPSASPLSPLRGEHKRSCSSVPLFSRSESEQEGLGESVVPSFLFPLHGFLCSLFLVLVFERNGGERRCLFGHSSLGPSEKRRTQKEDTLLFHIEREPCVILHIMCNFMRTV